MTLRGRPKPIDVHLLDGSFRKDRHGSPSQAVRPEGVPTMPPKMKGDAKALWEQVVPDLVAAGVVGASDTPQLIGLCEWHARYVRFSRLLDSAKDGAKNLASLMSAANKAWILFDKAAAKFGLTPVDRPRVHAHQPTASKVATRKRSDEPA